MGKQKRQHFHTKKKRYLMLYGYVVAILLILTTVSTYAWFSLTSTPRVSNLNIYINSAPGMELSVDPVGKGWTEQLLYEDLFADTYLLRPATWSEQDQMFYGATYSMDGKLKDHWEPLVGDRYFNNTSRDNYYCIGTFYARAGSGIQVSLAPALAIEDGLAASGTYLMGEPAWNEKDILHDNNGKGAENAIRIGIKVTRLNADYTPTDAPADFFIYEPNADAHNEGVFGYVDTPSIDGTDTLIEKDRIITQSVSYWYETDPVQRDVLVHHMGKFDGSSVLFSMDVDEVVKIQMIVWLEGQDVDCTNAIADARIVGNLQFEVKNIGGSGLVPIPSDDTES